MKKRLFALFCVCLMLCALLPVSAAADSAIDKVLCTTSSIPVAQASAKDIYAATSTAGCYIESCTWRDTTNGYIIYQLFPTNNVELEIVLRANEGWYFSEGLAVYLNNSSADHYIGEGGSTLTLTRTYSPELWAPAVIKNPGSETVDEGSFASFVATATVTSEYKWYLYDPANDKSYPAADTASLFAGTSIQENGEGKLNIYNIPAAMDGWQVYCVFAGPGGEVKSQKAGINVNYETPPPTATPEPTPEPTATPEPTEAPADTAKPKESRAPDHAHTFTADWHSSEALHWRECGCGARTDEGVHTLVWEVKREATKREPGLSVGSCETCGYTAEKETDYDNSSSILRYIFLGLGGLVALTIIILVIDSIRSSRRRRRRRRRRR